MQWGEQGATAFSSNEKINLLKFRIYYVLILAASWLLNKLSSFLRFAMFVLGSFSENVFSPKGWQKNSQNCKIPKCSDLHDILMILPISICNFDAKTTPDAFKHVPDLF